MPAPAFIGNTAQLAVGLRSGLVNVLDATNHWFLMTMMIVEGIDQMGFWLWRQKEDVAPDDKAKTNMQDHVATIALLIRRLHSTK